MDDNLKESFRQFRIEHDARIAEVYATKEDIAENYATKDELAQVSSGGASSIEIGDFSSADVEYIFSDD